MMARILLQLTGEFGGWDVIYDKMSFCSVGTCVGWGLFQQRESLLCKQGCGLCSLQGQILPCICLLVPLRALPPCSCPLIIKDHFPVVAASSNTSQHLSSSLIRKWPNHPTCEILDEKFLFVKAGGKKAWSMFGLTGLSSDRGAKPFICRILHLFMSGGVVGCHTFCWSVAGIKVPWHEGWMLLMPPIVPPLSDCLWGLFFTSVSLVCLVTVTEVQLAGHHLYLTFTCMKQRFLLFKPQFLVGIFEKYKEKG